MDLAEIIGHLEAIEIDRSPSHLARLLLLLVQDDTESLDELSDRNTILTRLKPIRIKLQSAQDQESAVAHELDSLAATQPAEFSPSHVWTLIRAIKVQKQILDLYQGVPVPS